MNLNSGVDTEFDMAFRTKSQAKAATTRNYTAATMAGVMEYDHRTSTGGARANDLCFASSVT